jgi:hypothetical protein
MATASGDLVNNHKKMHYLCIVKGNFAPKKKINY